jgi:hypothetical protein
VDEPELCKVALKSLHAWTVEPFLLSFLILPPGIWCPMDPSIIGPWHCLKFEPAFSVYWRKIYSERQIYNTKFEIEVILEGFSIVKSGNKELK